MFFLSFVFFQSVVQNLSFDNSNRLCSFLKRIHITTLINSSDSIFVCFSDSAVQKYYTNFDYEVFSKIIFILISCYNNTSKGKFIKTKYYFNSII